MAAGFVVSYILGTGGPPQYWGQKTLRKSLTWWET
jgi:hypothetical protein